MDKSKQTIHLNYVLKPHISWRSSDKGYYCDVPENKYSMISKLRKVFLEMAPQCQER